MVSQKQHLLRVWEGNKGCKSRDRRRWKRMRSCYDVNYRLMTSLVHRWSLLTISLIVRKDCICCCWCCCCWFGWDGWVLAGWLVIWWSTLCSPSTPSDSFVNGSSDVDSRVVPPFLNDTSSVFGPSVESMLVAPIVADEIFFSSTGSTFIELRGKSWWLDNKEERDRLDCCDTIGVWFGRLIWFGVDWSVESVEIGRLIEPDGMEPIPTPTLGKGSKASSGLLIPTDGWVNGMEWNGMKWNGCVCVCFGTVSVTLIVSV